MFAQKNKKISTLRCKSYNFDRPSHIALSDFIRIQNSISPVNTELEERQAYEERLKRLSKEKSQRIDHVSTWGRTARCCYRNHSVLEIWKLPCTLRKAVVQYPCFISDFGVLCLQDF